MFGTPRRSLTLSRLFSSRRSRVHPIKPPTPPQSPKVTSRQLETSFKTQIKWIVYKYQVQISHEKRDWEEYHKYQPTIKDLPETSVVYSRFNTIIKRLDWHKKNENETELTFKPYTAVVKLVKEYSGIKPTITGYIHVTVKKNNNPVLDFSVGVNEPFDNNTFNGLDSIKLDAFHTNTPAAQSGAAKKKHRSKRTTPRAG